MLKLWKDFVNIESYRICILYQLKFGLITYLNKAFSRQALCVINDFKMGFHQSWLSKKLTINKKGIIRQKLLLKSAIKSELSQHIIMNDKMVILPGPTMNNSQERIFLQSLFLSFLGHKSLYRTFQLKCHVSKKS